jgi:hypothetical protein
MQVCKWTKICANVAVTYLYRTHKDELLSIKYCKFVCVKLSTIFWNYRPQYSFFFTLMNCVTLFFFVKLRIVLLWCTRSMKVADLRCRPTVLGQEDTSTRGELYLQSSELRRAEVSRFWTKVSWASWSAKNRSTGAGRGAGKRQRTRVGNREIVGFNPTARIASDFLQSAGPDTLASLARPN